MPQSLHYKYGCGWFQDEPAEVGIATNDIRNQKEHHKSVSFEDEFLQFLKHMISSTNSDMFEMSKIAGDLTGRVRLLSV